MKEISICCNWKVILFFNFLHRLNAYVFVCVSVCTCVTFGCVCECLCVCTHNFSCVCECMYVCMTECSYERSDESSLQLLSDSAVCVLCDMPEQQPTTDAQGKKKHVRPPLWFFNLFFFLLISHRALYSHSLSHPLLFSSTSISHRRLEMPQTFHSCCCNLVTEEIM